MTPLLLLVALASTPLIEGYVSACAAPVDGFVVSAGATAPAGGTVSAVKEGHVELVHCFYENAQARTVRTVVEGRSTTWCRWARPWCCSELNWRQRTTTAFTSPRRH